MSRIFNSAPFAMLFITGNICTENCVREKFHHCMYGRADGSQTEHLEVALRQCQSFVGETLLMFGNSDMGLQLDDHASLLFYLALDTPYLLSRFQIH